MIKESINDWFVDEVKERMDELGLRPYHLMPLCDMTETEVEDCLNGTKLPNLYSLVLLAEHLECTVNDLLGYEEVENLDVYELYEVSCMFFKKTQYAVCLSDRVRRYLNDRNMTLADVAKESNVNFGSIRHWFAKSRPYLPSTPKFLQICDALGCTPTELLGY